jgi:cytochrome c-type biogenesis protein CcmH/NrfG
VPRDALDDGWTDEPPAVAANASSGKAARRSVALAAPAHRTSRGGIHPVVRRGAVVVAGAAVMVGIAFGGYSLGAPRATPAPSAAAAADDAAFQQQVAGLMQKLAANPSDVPTLLALGNVYYQAQDYETAADWMRKLLAIDAKHIEGLLAYGAARFNLADYQTAESSWKQVLSLQPDNVEAYYDLGFLYFSDNPPKVDLVRQMWGKVVELAPDSSIAKTVGSHLQSLTSLASGAPAASPASAGNGAPLASPSTPAASGAPVAAPSAPATSPGPG